MERVWLKQYPAGVPADIDVTQYASLVALLEESFAKFANRKAFICMDKSISYRDLDEMSQAFGAYLQSKGLQKGARVALMMPNVLQYPIATAAVLRAGGVNLRIPNPRDIAGFLNLMPRPAASASLKLTEPGNEKAGTIFFTRRTTRLTMTPLKPSSSPRLETITCLTVVFAITCCTVWAKFSSTMIASAPESLS